MTELIVKITRLHTGEVLHRFVPCHLNERRIRRDIKQLYPGTFSVEFSPSKTGDQALLAFDLDNDLAMMTNYSAQTGETCITEKSHLTLERAASTLSLAVGNVECLDEIESGDEGEDEKIRARQQICFTDFF